MKNTYNDYIASIDKDKCMDCGSADIHYDTDHKGKFKECKRCGKAYYI
jgi:hypothetical protein